jgi:2,4-dichlorophenol 6-monooxygenase
MTMTSETTDRRVPVLVVGGGAGLTASMLLSTYGVDRLLISALPTTSVLPKAQGCVRRRAAGDP